MPCSMMTPIIQSLTFKRMFKKRNTFLKIASEKMVNLTPVFEIWNLSSTRNYELGKVHEILASHYNKNKIFKAWF